MAVVVAVAAAHVAAEAIQFGAVALELAGVFAASFVVVAVVGSLAAAA